MTERNYRDVSPDSDDLDNPSENEALPPFPMLVVLEGSLALVALLLGWALDHHPLSDFEWSPRAAIQGLEATLPLIGLLWLSHRWKIEPILRIHDFLRRELLPYLDGANLLDFAMLSLAAGVGEEILFRGIVQPVISLQVGVIAGLVLTSLIFGCLHPVSLNYVIVATLIGGYLGVVWLISGNILAPIVTHAVYDFLALILLRQEMDSAVPSEE